MNKKRIAFLLPSLGAGGAERVGALLANRFTKKDKVFLIVLSKTKPIYKIDDKVQLFYLEEDFYTSGSIFQAIRNNFTIFTKVIKILRQNKVDILIGFTTSVNVITVICANFLRIPNIISERNNPKVYIPNVFWRFLRNTSYFFTDSLVVQTDYIKYFYKRKVKENKIIVIPNPIDENKLALKVPYINRENVILTVGRLDENKNQKMLIKAFANLNSDDWRLVIVGDGILKNEYEKLAISLGIKQRVEFIGNVQNVWDYYNKAKIFAFTSRSEGFPNALLEAISFGLPCISTDCPSGPSEIITNNKNGFLIDVDNELQLKEKLLELMENPKLCSDFSNNAMETSEKFKLSKIVKDWEKLVLEFTN